jgi:hypothetical protein
MIRTCFIILLLTVSVAGMAQRKKQPAKKSTKSTKTTKAKPKAATDTTVKEIKVFSAFKPSLRTAPKVNFSAATPVADTSAPKINYSVPNQNLFFSYEPIALKPLALGIDSVNEWASNNYIKAGFGNFSTPYLQAGLSFGDGSRSVVNVHTRHTSSKGNLPFQQFGQSNLDVIGVFNAANNNDEWTAKLGFDNQTTHRYGFLPDTLKFTKDQLKLRYSTFSANVSLRNKVASSFGISYNPSLALNLFNDNWGAKETNLVAKAPISKTFGNAFAFDLGLTADITNYKAASTIKNNLFYITPAVRVKSPNFSFSAGFSPTWDNQVFNLLPNFTLQAKLKDERFVLLGGYVGYFVKNNFQTLVGINPWIQQPDALLNTRITEQYAGFKGSAGAHFTYNAKVSYLDFSNQPLFINDSIDGKSFRVVKETKMKALKIHGELGYTIQDKFSLLAGINFNQFSNLEVNERAWGLIPLEVTAALRWQMLKDVTIKSDFFFWDGPQYRNKFAQSRKQKAAIDWSAGVEFSVMRKLSLWVQFNNMLQNEYQRWNQYQVLGFNVVGGIVYSFSQSPKK